MRTRTRCYRFAPYSLQYEGLQEHMLAAHLVVTPKSETPAAVTVELCTALKNSAWSNVKDFKWLRSQQSPNWCILPESDRITSAAGVEQLSIRQL
jgi:tubulin-specific chaperone C